MKIHELNNLFTGYNETEDFRILICALDTKEAQEIANSYKLDSHMNGSFKISKPQPNETYDCDYVVTYTK